MEHRLVLAGSSPSSVEPGEMVDPTTGEPSVPAIDHENNYDEASRSEREHDE